ncbi:hypothetical protein M422DRAFT_247660 [Sphaerobolus stellatus SS14]|nr:hypothetical protein M422DRAFT_247660 [Sphaerobolus stellatus SS14]
MSSAQSKAEAWQTPPRTQGMVIPASVEYSAELEWRASQPANSQDSDTNCQDSPVGCGKRRPEWATENELQDVPGHADVLNYRIWPPKPLELDTEAEDYENERRRRLFWRQGRPWEQEEGALATIPNGRWAIRLGAYEDHWARLDVHINSYRTAPEDPPCEYPISLERCPPFALMHYMFDADYVPKGTTTYVEELRQYTLRKQPWRNRAQVEMWNYVTNMHYALSHIGLAHSRSDLGLVRDALVALDSCVHGMKVMVEAEEDAMLSLDIQGNGQPREKEVHTI